MLCVGEFVQESTNWERKPVKNNMSSSAGSYVTNVRWFVTRAAFVSAERRSKRKLYCGSFRIIVFMGEVNAFDGACGNDCNNDIRLWCDGADGERNR
jgi:hypothetical protein